MRWAALAPAGLVLATLLLLTACATPQVSKLNAQWPPEVPYRVTLNDVPFFAQEDYECGPAALAMAFHSAGLDIAPGALVEQVFVPSKKGALQVEMLAATRRQGLLAYTLEPKLQAILREVSAGHPVVVFQNLSLPVYPVWHYAVVIGFDRDRNVLTLHTGTSKASEISMYAFERTWARGNYWAMVALRPANLPTTAQPDALALALAALERSSATSAQAGYTAGLARWPDHRGLLFGAANAAYATGNLPKALQDYQQLVSLHPDFADAWNNLAQVLFEAQQWEAAQAAIARAISLGGPRLKHYEALKALITKR
jgi:tetratricopeptide (TPR) repeat protein